MKRRLYLILLLATISLCGMAQNIGDAFYVFRNNGQINGFLPKEVESMEFSYKDADGNIYDEIVSQIINTIDSVYIIPLAEIDSISFVTPKTEYQPDAINLSDQLMPYVEKSDSLTIIFSKSTPSSLLPVVGNKVVTLEMNDKFPYGFAGEVTSIKEVADGYSVDCTLANLEDIFITYYKTSSAYGYCIPEENNVAASRSSYRTRNWLNNITDWGFAYGIPLNKLSFKYGEELDRHRKSNDDIAGALSTEFSIGITPQFHIISTMIIRRGEGAYFCGSITGNITLEEELAFSGGIQWSNDNPFTTLYVPIPDFPIASFYIQPGLFFNANASLSVAAKWSQEFTFGASFEMASEGKQAIRPTLGGRMVSSNFDIEGSLDGSFAVGLYLETGLSIYCRDVSRACVRGELGAEFVGSYVLSNFDINDTDNSTKAYERLKNSSFEVNVFTNAIAEQRTGIWGRVHNLDTWNLTYNINTWDIVPTFSNVNGSKSQEKANTYNCNADVSNDLLFPVRVGFGIYDKEDVLLESKFCTESYRVRNNWKEKVLSQIFEDLKIGEKYTCSPMVSLLGVELRAAPSVTIGEDLQVQTGDVKNITASSADTYGRIITEDPSNISEYEYGICYTEKGTSDGWDYIPSQMDESGKFFVSLGNLRPETEYIYCAYIKVGKDDYLYGEEKAFATESTAAIIQTGEARNILNTGADLYGKISPDGSISYSYGIDYKIKDSTDEWTRRYSYDIDESGNYHVLLTNLTPETDYLYRAFFQINGDGGDIYGEIKTFTTDVIKEFTGNICPDDNHPHYIDLGLPSGTLWKCCNAGASRPEEYGNYFWNHWKDEGWHNYEEYQCETCEYSLPFGEQIMEIMNHDYVSQEVFRLNGVNGTKITSHNGNAIFLPYAGYYLNEWIGNNKVYHMTSKLQESGKGGAYFVNLNEPKNSSYVGEGIVFSHWSDYQKASIREVK